MYEYRLQFDVPEPRPEKGRLATGYDGTMLAQGFRTSGIWIDPCTLTAMLKPLPLTELWATSYTGNYARFDPNAAYTIPTPTKWERIQIRAAGDFFLRAKQATSEIVQVTSALSANQPMFMTWYKPDVKIMADSPVLRVYYNYQAATTSGELKIVFYSSGKCEIYKNGLLVGEYDRQGSNFAAGSGYVATYSTNQQFNDILIIPYRRRELLVHTNYGLSFTHVFTDLDESLTNNVITPAGKFAFSVPTGKAALQVALCKFSQSGTFVASQQVLRYAPPATVAGPPVYPLFTYESYGDTCGPTGDTLTTSTSLVWEQTGVADWTAWPTIDNGVSSSWDGVKKTVRVKVSLSNNNRTQTPTIYGVEAYFDPYPTQTYNGITDVSSTVKSMGLEVGEDGRAQLSLECWSSLIASTGVAQPEITSDRPFRLQIKTKDAVAGYGAYSANVTINAGNPQIPSGGNTYAVNDTVQFDTNAGNIIAGNFYIVATVTGTTSFTLAGITPTEYGTLKHRKLNTGPLSTNVTINSGIAQIPAGGNTYVVGDTVKFNSNYGNINANTLYEIETVTGTTSFTLAGITPTEYGTVKHQKVILTSPAVFCDLIIGTLSSPKIARGENDYSDKWSIYQYDGFDRGNDFDITMVQASPALDDYPFGNAIRNLIRLCGFVDDGGAYDNCSVFIADDGLPGEFVLPFTTNASKGEWAWDVERGETVGGALDRLQQDFAATWVKGWMPNSNNAGGYTYAWEKPNTTPTAADITVWQKLTDARDPAKGNLPMPYASFCTIRSLSVWTEPAECNSVVVVGRDPRRGQMIYGYYQDGPSQTATTAPASRPMNWRGRPVHYILTDPNLTSQSKVDYSVGILQDRLTQNRELIEFDSDLLIRNLGAPEDQRPIWINDIVKLMGPTGTSVLGWYRVISIPQIEFVIDGSNRIPVRRCTYRCERVTIPS